MKPIESDQEILLNDAEGIGINGEEREDPTQVILFNSGNLDTVEGECGGETVDTPPTTASPAFSWNPWTMVTRAVSRTLSHPAVKYALFTKQTEDSLLQFYELLQVFFNDFDLSFFEFTTAVLLLNARHNQLISPSPFSLRTSLPVPGKEAHQCQTYVRFAVAAYGWSVAHGLALRGGLRGVLAGVWEGGAAQHVAALAQLTGVDEEHVLAAQWEASAVYDPAWYLCEHRRARELVLAIRGTYELRDALTDLAGRAAPFLDGAAHEGMAQCAWRKYADLLPTLLEELRRRPGYRLTLVGHSLGAGVAALLACILELKHPGMRVRGFCFATPCVMSLDLAARCADFVTTVSVGDDCVTRLSLGSLEELKRYLTLISRQDPEKSGWRRASEALWLSEARIDWDEIERDFRMFEPAEKLFPAGRIINLYREVADVADRRSYDSCANGDDDAEDGGERDLEGALLGKDAPPTMRMEISAPSLFGRLIISNRLFTDHLPTNFLFFIEETVARDFHVDGIDDLSVLPTKEDLLDALPRCVVFRGFPAEDGDLAGGLARALCAKFPSVRMRRLVAYGGRDEAVVCFSSPDDARAVVDAVEASPHTLDGVIVEPLRIDFFHGNSEAEFHFMQSIVE